MKDPTDEFSDAQFHRYARHLILEEVGDEGQAKLLASKVLVIGAGGLGSPVLMYLAAAGVGTLGVVDDDVVDLSNLQRQVIHPTANLDRPKVVSAAETIAAINPDVTVASHRERFTADNAAALVADYDLVVDGSDNFATRYLVNDACFFARVPFVSAALLRFEGQLSVFRGYEADQPCYRCLFPEPPPPNLIPRCEEAGILGALAGVMGTLQAAESVKVLLGLGDALCGRLLLYDALPARFQTIAFAKNPDCPLCGRAPVITDLSDHAAGQN